MPPAGGLVDEANSAQPKFQARAVARCKWPQTGFALGAVQCAALIAPYGSDEYGLLRQPAIWLFPLHADLVK